MAARARLPVHITVFLLLVVVLVAGIWIAGGLITNRFIVAMWLTIAWMALSGLACLVVAVRRRDLRWPVIAAYLTVAVASGIILGRSELFDDVVHERVAVVAPSAAFPPRQSPTGQRRQVDTLIASGRFVGVAHASRGRAQAIRLAGGGRVLTITHLNTSNGPDLRVYLVAGPATTESQVKDKVDLGGLKGNIGDMQYKLPAEVDLRRYQTVVIWCRAFTVLFARAPLS